MKEVDKTTITTRIPFSFTDMVAFNKLMWELRFENRFFPSESSTRFVEGLIHYAKRFKTHSFTKGEKFFRARVHDLKMETSNFPREKMGAPLNHEAKNGRLNPSGIPYLYLADSIETAVSEVRPWIDCDLTVAEFEIERDLSFVTFSRKRFGDIAVEQPEELEKFAAAETTWREFITFMFSCPFDPRDDAAYAPTQYVAERVKKEGFDGIIYDSTLKQGGFNIALFSPTSAAPSKLLKVRVLSTTYKMNVSEVQEVEG